MIHSWGQYPDIPSKKRECWWLDEVPSYQENGLRLPVGLGRSYGDSATLAEKDGELLGMIRCDRLLSYDCETNELEVEAGCSIEKILKWSLPRGLFLPVVPGTRYVTIGGALANDIHGKNHHERGTFGRAVGELDLWRSDEQQVMTCLPNEKFFEATIGGLGLTGVVTRVKLYLAKIEGQGLVEEETSRFQSINEACDLLEDMDSRYPMTVAWIDMGSGNAGCGVAMGGRFVEGHCDELGSSRIRVPGAAPDVLLNRFSIGLFNRLYGWSKRDGVKRVSCGSYFFPLDGVGGWNQLYGKRGFLQYQCVVPIEAKEVLELIRQKVLSSDERAFLSVLKKFGNLTSPGWLSFPQPGWTLAMDFPMRGNSTLALLSQLDDIVAGCGGRIYPAKDARMEASFFRESYPRWEELEKLRDPQMMSAFWKRVKG